MGRNAFAQHERWLSERLELDLELDQIESKHYARFVLSFLIQKDQIDPCREKELFLYNKPSPSSQALDDLDSLYMDTRTPEEVTICELHRASPVPLENVT